LKNVEATDVLNLFIYFAVLGFELRALHLLGSEPLHQPLNIFILCRNSGEFSPSLSQQASVQRLLFDFFVLCHMGC
jgi:hypothetical protein